MVWRVTPSGALGGKVAIVTGTSRGVGVGTAHELLRAGATVIGCSRSKLDTIPGADQHEAWLQRSAQMVCDQGDFGAIDAMVPDLEDVPELVARIQGAPRAEDDFERTALFHSFAIQMNLISPLVRAARLPADATPGRRRFHHQHL